MKRYAKFLMLTAALVAMVLPYSLMAQSTSLTVANGTVTNEYVPVYGYYADEYQHNQMIYPASMLTAMSGSYITQMQWYLSTAADDAWGVSVTVSLAIVADSIFGTNLLSPTLVPVWSGTLNGTTSNMIIPFQSPFHYTGGNLLVDVQFNSANDYSEAEFYGVTRSDASLMSYGESLPTSTVNAEWYTVEDFLPKATFTYDPNADFCVAPLAVTADSLSSDFVRLTWVGSATSYGIEWGESDVFSSGNGTIGYATNTSFELQGLSDGTSYTVLLWSNCGTSVSDTVTFSFITPGAPIEIFPYSTGFETDAGEDVAWSFNNGSAINRWVIDTAVNHTPGGISALYISNDGGVSNSYNNSALSTVYAYRMLHLSVPGEYVVSFDWRAEGESGSGNYYFDYLSAYIAPGTCDLTANNVNTAGWTPLGGMLGGSATWTHFGDMFSINDTGYFYLVFCWTNDYSDGSDPAAAVDNVTVERVSCQQPLQLIVNTTSATEAELSWTLNGTESSWVVSVNGGDWQPVSVFPYTVTGLTPGSNNTFAIRAVCSNGDTSLATYASAWTTCMPIATLPYIEDFETMPIGASAGFSPCWNKGSSSMSPYPYVDSYGSSHVLRSYCESGDYCYAIMPEIADAIDISSLELSFDIRKSSLTASNGGHMVVAVLDTNVWAQGQSYDAIAVFDETGSDFVTRHVNFSSYTGNGRRIAFLFFNANGTSYNYVQIDNIDLHLVPTCFTVEDLSFGNTTPSTMMVTWSDPTNNAGGYRVEYRPVGATDDVEWDAVTVTDTFAILSGLNAASAYDVCVRAICAVGDTSRAVNGSSRTACDVVSQLPWYESFDDITVTQSTPMPCWSHLGGGYVATQVGNTVYGGPNYLMFDPSGSASGNIMVLPEFDMDVNELELVLWARPEGSASGALGVGYITNLADTASFVQLANYPVSYWTSNASISTWLRIRQTFGGAPSGARIAVRHNVNNTSWYWYVDNFDVHVAPSCLPPSSVSAVEATCNSITASIIGQEGSMFRIWLSQNGAVIDSVDISDTAYTFTDLTPLTTYSIVAATICSDGTLTEAESTIGQTTACGEYLPYSTGFESSQDNAWSFCSGYQTNTWYIGSAVSHGGSRSLYISSNSGNSNSYNLGGTSSTYAFKAFTFDAGQYEVSFDWKANGESNYDYLRAFMAPGTLAFEAGLTYGIGTTGAPAGWTAVDGGEKLNLVTSWQTQSTVITVNEPTTMYLVFYWHNNNSLGNNPPAAVDNVLIEPVDCPAPTAFAIDSIGTNAAFLEWIPIGSESQWGVSVNGGAEQIVYTNSYTVSGLTPGSNYSFALRAICGAGDTSVPVVISAYTACTPIVTLPYSQNFETLQDGPDADFDPCWSKGASNQSAYPYVTLDATNKVLDAFTFGNNYCYAIMPVVDGAMSLSDMELSFDMRRQVGGDSYDAHVMVAAIDDDVWSPTVAFDTLAVFDETSSNFVEKYINLSSYSGSHRRIAFVFSTAAGSTSNYVQVDNIELRALPACPRPDVPVVTSVSHDQIEISFSGSATGNYRLYITSAAGTDSANTSLVSSYTFTGLTPLTTYTIGVAANCGTAVSQPVNIVVTTGMVAATLPYSTGFENSHDNAWRLHSGNSTNRWAIGSATASGSDRSLYVSNNSGTSNAYDRSDPSFVFAYKDIVFDAIGEYIFQYDWKADGECDGDYLRAFLVPATYDILADHSNGISFNGTPEGWIALDGGHQLVGSNNWQTRTATTNLTSELLAASNIYHLLFYWCNDASLGSNPPAAIDNVQVALHSCFAPEVIFLDAVSTNSATFHWTPSGSESQWAVSVGGQNAVVTTPSCTVTGLSEHTNYTARIRPICGVGDTGFASTLNFSTVMCENATVSDNSTATTSIETENGPIGHSFYSYSYVQTIIPAADLNSVNGDINAFSFLPAATTAGTYFNHVDVYLANVVEEDLSAGFIHPDGVHTFVKVLTDANLSFDSVSWQTHSFDSTFTWDGTSNVLVAVNRSHGYWASNGSFAAHTDTLLRTRYAGNDNNPFNISNVSGGTATNVVGNMRLISCGEACVKPVINIATATDYTVRIAWTGQSENYYVAITENGMWDESVTGTLVTGHNHTFTGLTSATEYLVGVRQVCSDGVYSGWTLRSLETSDRPCESVADISIGEISYNTATVSWLPQGGESAWNVRIYNNTFNRLYTATDATRTVDGLIPGVTYHVDVQPLCGSDANIGGPWGSPMTFTTDDCQRVTGVQVSEVTGSTATVSWNPAAIGTGSYRVEYGYAGFAQGMGQAVIVNTNSYTIEGLEGQTMYDVYVANICAEGVTSLWSQSVSFTTDFNSIADVDAENLLSIYPNPASSDVTISVSVPATVMIIDLSGRVALPPTEVNSSIIIPHSSLASGAYFVRMTNSTTTVVRKLIVK